MRQLFVALFTAISINGTAQIPSDSLSLWLLSDTGVTTNGSDVIGWADQSGNSRDAVTTQGLPQLVPNELCSYPVIRFNGSSGGMTTPAFDSFSNKRGTIFVVSKVLGAGNGGMGFGSMVSTWQGSGVTWQFGASPTDYWWFDGIGTNGTPIISSPPSDWGILTLNRNYDDTLQFYKSGVLVQNHVVGNVQPTLNTVKIGYSTVYEVLNGDIAEIIIYNRSLNDAEVYQVNTYLANKYCFNANVPQPSASNETECGPTSVVLTASGGTQYRWYDDLSSSTILGTNSTFVTPVLSVTDTFYVANYDGSLESPRTMVIANILQSSSSTDGITACNSYTWIDGVTYTADNITATHTLTNAVGCDSIVYLDLNIVNVNTGITTSGITISADLVGASYSWINCSDNSVIPGETGQTFVATANGDYAVIVDNGNCSDTSACETIATVGIEEELIASLRVYPNPSKGNFSINFEGKILGITMVDLVGRSIPLKVDLNQGKVETEALSSGKYFIAIKTEYGSYVREIVIE